MLRVSREKSKGRKEVDPFIDLLNKYKDSQVHYKKDIKNEERSFKKNE